MSLRDKLAGDVGEDGQAISDTAAAILTALELGDAEIDEVSRPVSEGSAIPYAIVPAGKSIESLKHILDEWLDKPVRRIGTFTFEDQTSLIDYVNLNKSDKTSIYVNRVPSSLASPARVVAVFNGHPQDGDHEDAGFSDYRATVNLLASPEWQAWRGTDQKWQDQATFARFIEDRIGDVVSVNKSPDNKHLNELAELFGASFATPGGLVQLSRGLQVTQKNVVKEAVTLADGTSTVSFVEENAPRQAVPGLFAIAVPIFHGGDSYRIPVRLRYRIHENRLQWSTALYQAEHAIEDALSLTVKAIRDQTDLSVYFGQAPSAD